MRQWEGRGSGSNTDGKSSGIFLHSHDTAAGSRTAAHVSTGCLPEFFLCWFLCVSSYVRTAATFSICTRIAVLLTRIFAC